MVIVQSRSKRKPTGGRYKPYRKKRMYEMGRAPTLTRIDERKLKLVRTRGGNKKYRLLRTNIANVLDKKTNKYEKVKIISVIDNPANRHFVRRNIITKGTIIKTEKGDAKVTSRPGQDGTVNAVLISS
ncbi:MAG: 30S ribosomal protein S8e [Candidatus Heimdallarchaeaceae archaeon]